MGKVLDLTGEKYGSLTALSKTEKRSKRGTLIWLCKCDCGREKEVDGSALKRGEIKSCGCRYEDLTGQAFGELTAIRCIGIKDKNLTWLCKCSCGGEKEVYATKLKSGRVISCGCRKGNHKKKIKDSKSKDSFESLIEKDKGTLLLHNLKVLKQKCTDTNYKDYNNYGGRGITYDKRWDDENEFIKDMKESFHKHIKKYGDMNVIIDRIDLNANFCKENCKWSTIKEYNDKIENIKYDNKSIKEWCDMYPKMRYNKVIYNMNKGMSIQYALAEEWNRVYSDESTNT